MGIISYFILEIFYPNLLGNLNIFKITEIVEQLILCDVTSLKLLIKNRYKAIKFQCKSGQLLTKV